MAEEEPDIVDSVTEATNGIGSEALAAISNLGGGSGSLATSVVSRIGASISGRSGGFAPKVITTVTKHGLAAIDRVEPIQGVDESRRLSSANQKSPISDDVDRGYRAVARDANGLESIRTVLDLDPRAYDVTVTCEGGVAVVEFVQQEPEPEAALPAGQGDTVTSDDADIATSNDATPEPMAPATEASPAAPRDRAPVTTTANGAAPLDTDGSSRVQTTSNRSVPAGDHGLEVQRARAEAETTKAKAEAQKARAEAEKAKAEAAAVKARAEAERANAEADVEKLRDEAQTTENHRPTVESRDCRDTSQFSAGRDLDSGFDTGRRDAKNAAEPTGGWGLRDEPNGTEANAVGESDSSDDDGFGEFTPATPVEGTEDEATGKFQF